MLRLPRFAPHLERQYHQRREKSLRSVVRIFVPLVAINLFAFGLWDWLMQPHNLDYTMTLRTLGVLGIGVLAWLYARRYLTAAAYVHLVLGLVFAVSCGVMVTLENGLTLSLAYLIGIFAGHNLLMVRFQDLWIVALESAVLVALGAYFKMPALDFYNLLIAMGWVQGFILLFYFMLDSFYRHSFLNELRIEAQARTDELTGIYNRRTFTEVAHSELERVQRYHHPLSLLLLDIDRFKNINDTYGHDVGDQVIVAVAATCQSLIRQSDTAGRMGGEEFGLLLPETPLEAAQALAERLRQTLQDLEVQTRQGPVHITVSVGVAALEKEQSWHQLLKSADIALYQAKNTGRNRVVASNHGLSLLSG